MGIEQEKASPETNYPGISAERLHAAEVADTLAEFRRNAGNTIAITGLSAADPAALAYLLQAANKQTAFEAWRKLKELGDGVSTGVLIHTVLNTRYPSIVLEAWRLASTRLDLTREQMRSVAAHATDPNVRAEAAALIGR
ncbi:MAG: hypothetical protein PHW10_05975 [Candidatus Peribacteraceae bacterium]|nr:hypothetical protein [Candidatus Peribacteraceae bacterium]